MSPIVHWAAVKRQIHFLRIKNESVFAVLGLDFGCRPGPALSALLAKS